MGDRKSLLRKYKKNLSDDLGSDDLGSDNLGIIVGESFIS